MPEMTLAQLIKRNESELELLKRSVTACRDDAKDENRSLTDDEKTLVKVWEHQIETSKANLERLRAAKPRSTDALSGLSAFKQVSALIEAVDDCTW